MSRLRETYLSGRRDSNPGPLAPKASALAGLRYAPMKFEMANLKPAYTRQIAQPRNGVGTGNRTLALKAPRASRTALRPDDGRGTDNPDLGAESATR